MATNEDTRATTIGKYIARFRQEKPRPREERGAAEGDFWWTQPRNNGLCSVSGGDVAAGQRRGVELEMETEDANADTKTSAAPLDWEVELLSGLSSSQATGGRAEGIASLGSSASLPAWSELGSSEQSPLTTSAWDARDASFQGVPATRTRAAFALEEPLVDDGFVVVDEAEDEEMKALETSLEDPEIVIQRIRRRLGFQPQQQTQRHYRQGGEHAMQPQSASLSSAYSPLRDEQLDMAELLSSFDSESATTPVQRHSIEQLELMLEADDRVEQASPAMKEETPQEQSADDQCEEEQPRGEQDKSRSETTIPVGVEASNVNDSEREVSEEDMGAESKSEAESEPASVRLADINDEFASEDEAPARSARRVDESSNSVSSTGSDARQSTNSTLSARRKLPPANDEKPSPRLPPLSPARSPMFRMALTPSASPSISPRMAGASQPPELTAETSKTLDNLLSLVVHSWGEDSFFGGSQASEDAVESTAAVECASVEGVAPPGEGNGEVTANGGVQVEESADDDEEKGDRDDFQDLEDIHAADPIVQMLRKRISVFEEALVRMERDADQGTDTTIDTVHAS